MTKFLLHQTDQNGLSHVISHVSDVTWQKSPTPKGDLGKFIYSCLHFDWIQSNWKVFLLVFITKHTKTNVTSRSLSFTQHNSYFVKNKIIILFFLFFLLILLAIDKCNRASSLAISVSQHCERAFRTPFICLCAPYMKRHSLRRSIKPKEGLNTTGASKIYSIFCI